MLIGLSPLLGPDLLHALRSMGHGDEIALVDGNYPATGHAQRLIRADGHGLMEILAAVLPILPIEAAFRAAQFNDPAQSAPIHRQIDETLARAGQKFPVTALDGDTLYPRIKAAYAIVATGERAHYANVILRKAALSPPI